MHYFKQWNKFCYSEGKFRQSKGCRLQLHNICFMKMLGQDDFLETESGISLSQRWMNLEIMIKQISASRTFVQELCTHHTYPRGNPSEPRDIVQRFIRNTVKLSLHTNVYSSTMFKTRGLVLLPSHVDYSNATNLVKLCTSNCINTMKILLDIRNLICRMYDVVMQSI